MDHKYVIPGSGFRLRPVTNDDAQFILQLRCSPTLSKYIHPTSDKLRDQLEWLDKYYRRDYDYYFIIESTRDGAREGLVSLYNVDLANGSGEWGRWILKEKSIAAVESCLLLYQFAFDYLSLNEVYSLTNSLNHKVVSFHDSCGIKHKEIVREYFEIAEKKYDAVKHTLTQREWIGIKKKLLGIASMIASKFNN
jgi:RimJ/RimL family protein N-acetyltransferase